MRVKVYGRPGVITGASGGPEHMNSYGSSTSHCSHRIKTMIEIDPSDPGHNWDEYDPEELVTAKIREYLIEDGDDDRIDLKQLRQAEHQLRNRHTDEQNERRDRHKAEEGKKTARQLSKGLTSQPAYLHAFKTFQYGATEHVKNAFKNSNFTTAATSDDVIRQLQQPVIPHADISDFTPAPNRTPEQLDDLISTGAVQLEEAREHNVHLRQVNTNLQDQLAEQKTLTEIAKTAAKDANTAAAASKERADDAEESAERSTYLTVASLLIAILGIATSIYFSTTPPHTQTPPQPDTKPSIEQTTE